VSGPPEDVLAVWFHQAALAVGFVAHAGGWLHDAERVRRAVYHLYETGEWADGGGRLTTAAGCATRGAPPTPAEGDPP
jgi:hypothetical protein